jgi:solute carrier family 25, member 42
MERLQCGAFSGLVAQTVTYPIEVTRRRMQTLGLVGQDTALGNLGCERQRALERPPSLVSTVRTLYLEQGVRGFFKGVSMNWMKGPIAFSISFTAFDSVQGILESDTERDHRRSQTLRRERY